MLILYNMGRVVVFIRMCAERVVVTLVCIVNVFSLHMFDLTTVLASLQADVYLADSSNGAMRRRDRGGSS